MGSYHPKTKEARFKSERVLYWLSTGAKASPADIAGEAPEAASLAGESGSASGAIDAVAAA